MQCDVWRGVAKSPRFVHAKCQLDHPACHGHERRALELQPGGRGVGPTAADAKLRDARLLHVPLPARRVVSLPQLLRPFARQLVVDARYQDPHGGVSKAASKTGRPAPPLRRQQRPSAVGRQRLVHRRLLQGRAVPGFALDVLTLHGVLEVVRRRGSNAVRVLPPRRRQHHEGERIRSVRADHRDRLPRLCVGDAHAHGSVAPVRRHGQRRR